MHKLWRSFGRKTSVRTDSQADRPTNSAEKVPDRG